MKASQSTLSWGVPGGLPLVLAIHSLIGGPRGSPPGESIAIHSLMGGPRGSPPGESIAIHSLLGGSRGISEVFINMKKSCIRMIKLSDKLCAYVTT